MPKLLVNLTNLNLILEDRDVAYHDRGFIVEILRTYNACSQADGIFGRGWSFNYGIRLTEEPSGAVVVTRGSGAEDRFRYTGNDKYVPPKGVYDQLGKNPDGSFRLWVKGERVFYEFDQSGRLIALRDPNSNVVSFLYDLNGLLSTVTDASGRTISFAYGDNNKVATMTDPMGRPVTFAYDTAGNLISSTDVAGVTSVFSYDGDSNLISLGTPNGTTSISYQEMPWGTCVASATDAAGNTTAYAFGQDFAVFVTDPNGYTTQYGHNDDGSTTYIVDPLGYTVTYGYDAAGNRSTATDANGHVSQLSYDARGNVTEVVDALGHTTTLLYDARDNLIDLTDAAGNVSVYDYDANDNLIRTTDALGNVAQFTYDTMGHPVTMTDPLGNTTAFGYDRCGNLVSVTDPLGNVTSFSYNLIGKVLTATDPLGNTWEYDYDPLGRLVRRIHPDGTEFTIHRYCSGVSGITDEEDRTTTYSHTAINQRSGITDPMGNVTGFDYDANGNMLCFIDPLGQTTIFAYDEANRLTQITYPEGTGDTYTYDAIGNVISKVDANGIVTGYSYDATGRLLAVAAPDVSISYSYDWAGNLSSMTDVTGTTRYTYDALNRLTQITYPAGQSLHYNYDAAGNLNSIVNPFGTIGYAYDAVNRLQALTLPTGQQVLYTYDGAGNVTEVAYPNGTYTTYSYDTRHRLLELTTYGPAGTIIADYTYTLDGVGNRTGVEYFQPSMPGFVAQATSYGYYVGNQLAEANGPEYDYDNNGNLVGIADGVLSTSFAYDALNRLAEMQTPTDAYYYLYNGLGQRVSRAVNGTPTWYVIDPNGHLPQVLAETDEAGNPAAFYVYDRTGLVAMISAEGNTYFYHYDGLGSTVAITDGSGQVVNSYAYTPYGRVVRHQESVANPFTYVGRYGVAEEGNGLYFMRARYYDAEMGRFTTKDPMLPWGWMSPYVYVRSNPINKLDPLGLKEFEMRIWIGGSVGYIVFGGGVYDVTIRDVATGEASLYTVKLFGLGVGLPAFRGSSKPIRFNVEDPCVTSASFEGLGYVGGISVEVAVGIKVGGGMKIPNGPFISGDMITWERGGVDIGVSHNITYWSR
jgi:RHS repeat-associated protein